MRSIGAFDAKTHLSRLLRDVEESKEEIIIHRHHRNVACLVPFNSAGTAGHAKSLDILAGLKKIRELQKTRMSGTVKSLVSEGRKR